MTKAVIFDIDGTLVDSVDFHEAFRRFGKQVEVDAIRSQIGKGGEHLMTVFLPREQVEREARQFCKYRKQFFTERFTPARKGFPCVRELFELDIYKRNAGIQDLVEAETSSDDAAQSKPEPGIFAAAPQRPRGVEPDEVITLGDAPYYAEAAGKAGMRTIEVLSGGFPLKDPEQAGCVRIYHDVAELMKQYDESPMVRPIEFARAD